MIMNNEERIKDRYRLLENLGEGLQRRTFVGIDESTGDTVVVKELRLLQAEGWKEIELFERGARTLRSLEHPQIPTFYDSFFDEERDRFYLIQEYIEGTDLKRLIAEGGRVGEEWLRDFLHSMLSILEYLQTMSPPVIHRDIKPSNIVMRPGGDFVLIDFDVVQTVVPDEVGGSTVAGTTGYMPPEQLLGRAQLASDIFALGVTAVHLATGMEPIQLPLRRGKLEFEDSSGLSEELNCVLTQMIEPRVQDRFQGAAQVRAALLGERRKEELPVEEVEVAAQKRALPALQRQWVQIRTEPQELQITVLARRRWALLPLFSLPIFSVIGLLIYWAMNSPFILSDLRCWRFLLPTILIYIASFFVLRWWTRRRVVDTGIEQSLRVSEAGVELLEARKFMWWGGRPRETTRWSISARNLRGVYLQSLRAEEQELSSSAPMWRWILESEDQARAGIVFVASSGHRYFVGQALLARPDKPGHSTRVEQLQQAFEEIKTYLGT